MHIKIIDIESNRKLVNENRIMSKPSPGKNAYVNF